MQTGLYRHFDKNGDLLYVGISLNVFMRLYQHKDSSHWFSEISTVTIEYFETRQDALIAEELAIKKEKPMHNIVFSKQIQNENTKSDEAEVDWLNSIKQSKTDLLKRIVQFKPVYTIKEIALMFNVSTQAVNKWINTKQIKIIGVELHTGNVINMITGWDLICFIENKSAK
jgi:excinuclease UvrABC nuclease subunit